MTQWRVSTLGEECDIYQPKTISTKEMKSSGEFPVYGANGQIGFYDKFNHEDSEVLLSCRGNCGTVNVSRPKSWINGNAMVCAPKTSDLSKDFLAYYLQSVDWKPVITGTAQPQITRQPLAKVQVPVPPLDEQRRIVETLDDHLSRLDKALAEIATAKSLVEKFAPSLFHKLISVDSHESRKIFFKDFITLQRGFDLPKQDRKSGSVPIVGSNGVLGFHDEAKVPGPGVVTGRSGTIGRVHFIEDDFWALNTTLYVKDFKGNHPLFVYEYLQTLDLKHFAGGSTVPSLDRNVLNDIEVVVPNFERQIEISREMALQRESMLVVLTRVKQLDSQFHQLRRSALNVAFAGTLGKEAR